MWLKLTCGGLQSAHTAAVAAACAEQGIRAHLLVRGERPAVPTGFHLLARMFAQVTYIQRSEYANRPAMLKKHAEQIKGSTAADINVSLAARLFCVLGLRLVMLEHVQGNMTWHNMFYTTDLTGWLDCLQGTCINQMMPSVFARHAVWNLVAFDCVQLQAWTFHLPTPLY